MSGTETAPRRVKVYQITSKPSSFAKVTAWARLTPNWLRNATIGTISKHMYTI